LKESIKASVKKDYIDINLKALERGIELAEELLSSGIKK
jgi:Pyruvate/2-oxoacid:ferredoxin oxidoreductase gamma subunit